MTNSSKYNFPNAQKVQVFEQVNTYIENNQVTDPEVKAALTDIQTLLTQLQAQHPHVTTETQALAIIDAEFTEIQQSNPHRLVALRQQLLNPERHLQAIKATLAEIAKHYLEESVWSKSAITYLDKMKHDRQTHPNSGSFAARSDRSQTTIVHQHFHDKAYGVAGNVEGNIIVPSSDSID
jgi:hypothetical protein